MGFCDHPQCSSTRIKRLGKAHDFLCEKYPRYHQWHHHPKHKKVHLGIAINVVVLVLVFCSIIALQISKYHAYAVSKPYVVTEKSQWDAGTNTNIDSDDISGSIKLMPDGSWSGRTWKTPPDALQSGSTAVLSGADIYTLRGNGDSAFWKYSTTQNSWTVLSSIPAGAFTGAHLCKGDADKLYAILGNTTKKFYSYTISTNAWTELEDTPDTTAGGSTIESDGTYIYLLRSGGNVEFWRFEIATGHWSNVANPSTIANVPAAAGLVAYGSDLIYDGVGNLYTLKAGNTAYVLVYNIAGNSWSAMTTNFPVAVNNSFGTLTYYNGYLYHQLAGTNALRSCQISGLTCQGGAWNVLTVTPANTTYGILVADGASDTIYVFQGASLNFWKYKISTNKYAGPLAVPVAISAGADLIWDGADIVYSIGPGTNMYYYTISTDTWVQCTAATAFCRNTGQPALASDTKMAKAGNYIYLVLGGNTTIYRYDITNGTAGWASAAIVGIANFGNGAALAYPGSGNFVYATRGAGTVNVYKLNITVWPPTSTSMDLPANMLVNAGGRIACIGTDVYVLLGNGNSRFFKYNGSWTAAPRAPFSPYYGTDFATYNNKIYAMAGNYRNTFYEFNGTSWRKLQNLPAYTYTDQGTYTGSSLEYIGNNNILSSRGAPANTTELNTYTIAAGNYLATGTYISPAMDLGYADSWSSFASAKTDNNGSVAVQTMSSADGNSWSGWADLNPNIGSPAPARYIKVKLVLSASGDLSQTPVVDSYTLNFNPDEEKPTNPAAPSFHCYSQEVGGTELVLDHNYKFMHPSCSWAAGADNSKSGVAGYYVYFGSNASADPAVDGTFQTSLSYTVNNPITPGVQKLFIKTRDNAGNISDTSVTGFSYTHDGDTPANMLLDSSAEFDGNGGNVAVKTDTSTLTDQIKLAGKAGFWKESRLTPLTTVANAGASLVYKSGVNKLYYAPSNGLLFYEYNITTDVWTAKASLPAGALIGDGGGIVNGMGNFIYAIRGGGAVGSSKFYRYDITNDVAGWDDSAAEDAPNYFGAGASMVFDGSRYVYAVRGGGDDAFYRFDPQTTSDGQWDTLESTVFGSPNQTSLNTISTGGKIAFDATNGYIYAIQGQSMPGGFARFNTRVAGSHWEPLSKFLPMAPTTGATIDYNQSVNALFYLPGSVRTINSKMYKFDISSQSWSEVTAAPVTIGAGCHAISAGNIEYILRGAGTAGFYKYDAVKNYWSVPVYNIFGSQYNGVQATNFYNTYAGAGMVKGDGNYIYTYRGNFDNMFIKYDMVSGNIMRLANLPTGTYTGAATAYDSVNKKIYMIPGSTEAALMNWFVYDIATDVWTEEAVNGAVVNAGAGASLTYDGARYVYYVPAGGSANWYRYDTVAALGSRWSAALAPAVPGTLSYGAKLVYKAPYIYTLRGSVTANLNVLYRIDTGNIAGGWTSLANLNQTMNYEGFLVDGGDNKLYAARGGNGDYNWWQYDIANPGWTNVGTVAPSLPGTMPGMITYGANAVNDGVNKTFVFTGPGTNAWGDGLYTYIAQKADSSFKESGQYTSYDIDLGQIPYHWSNLEVNYSTPYNSSLLVETSSYVNSTWENWQPALQEKVKANTHQYAINSTPAQHLKVRISMISGDGVFSPTITSYKVNYYPDTTAPDNPTALLSAKSAPTNGTDIINDGWTNTQTPTFSWPAAGATNGASDLSTGAGSGVAGYYLYFDQSSGDGTCQGNPQTTSGRLATNSSPLYQTSTSFSVPGNLVSSGDSGKTFCFRVTAKDNAGNVQTAPWQAFKIKFDLTPPSNPTQLTSAKSAATGGVDIGDDHWNKYQQPSFSWPASETAGGAQEVGTGSGVAEYYLYFGEANGQGVCQGNPQNTAGVLPPNEGALYYQPGTTFTVPANTLIDSQSGKTFCLRVAAKDNAGNTQAEPWQAFKYKFDNQAPSVEDAEVTVDPDSWTAVDSFTFTIKPGATDLAPTSGLWKYQYRTDGDPAGQWKDLSISMSNEQVVDTVLTLPNADHPTAKYTNGTNILRLRVKDAANNDSAIITKEYKFNNNAPLPPSNLTVDEKRKTVNDFTFSWGAPEGTPQGETVTYHYAVNKLPLTASNTISTTLNGVSGALADQAGENTFYVVAEVRGLIEWGNKASITFNADVPDPAPPSGASVKVSDISDKNEDVDPSGNSGEYRLVVSWNQPGSFDQSNFSEYKVYGTTTPEDNTSYRQIGSTQGTAFVHLGLQRDAAWSYYVTTTAKTRNESLASNNPQTTQAGQMPRETATGKFKFPPSINENASCYKFEISCDTGKKVQYSVGAKTATFGWNTSRNARPEVQYGIDPLNLIKTAAVSIAATSSSHEVTANNLNPETKYYYRVAFTDQDGNAGYYPPMTESPSSFTTTPSPKVATLKVDNVSLSSMFITWQSSVTSHGSVIYRKSTDSKKDEKIIEESSTNYSTDHSANLKELTPGTGYIFQIKAVDQEGNVFESDEYAQETLPMPRVNDDLKAENKKEVDSPTVNVAYTTNVSTTTVIKCTTQGGSSKTFVDLTKTKNHTAEISGLAPKAPYILEVSGTDDYGNEAEVKNFQITTESDTMPPKIVNMTEKKRVIGDGANAEAQLTVKLSSNEPTTMIVEAAEGVGTDRFDIVSNDDPLNTEHTIPLKLKEAGKTYSYRVSLKDAAGNLTVSEVKTIVIEKANKTAFEYTLSIFSRSFGWLSKLFTTQKQ